MAEPSWLMVLGSEGLPILSIASGSTGRRVSYRLHGQEMFAKIQDVCGKLVLAFQASAHAPSSIHQGNNLPFSRRTTSPEKGESEIGKGVGIDRKEAANWQQPIGFVKRGEKFSLTKASSIKNFHGTKAV